MPKIIELITLAEIAALELAFGPITVVILQPIESLGEMPEPDDSDARHEYYRQMMESNRGPVLVP